MPCAQRPQRNNYRVQQQQQQNPKSYLDEPSSLSLFSAFFFFEVKMFHVRKMFEKDSAHGRRDFTDDNSFLGF